jgi:hypothetical protein
MKEKPDQEWERDTGTFTRREAIKTLGGGFAAVVAAPRALTGHPLLHNPKQEERPQPNSLTPLQPRESGSARFKHTATTLRDGGVLIVGGELERPLSSVEVFDPLANRWWGAASLQLPRFHHAAALLPDGRVLVAGGYHQNPLSSAEIYDPNTNTWSHAASLHTPRLLHAAVTLPNGYVLVSGGCHLRPVASIELYDPAADRWIIL